MCIRDRLGRRLRVFLRTSEGNMGNTCVWHRKETPWSKAWRERLRGPCVGGPRQCECLQQDLYAWWSGMRFAVDWERIMKETAPQLRRKKIARFTQYVVKAKAKELMCMYFKAQLEVGVKVERIDLRSRWFSHLRHEYGLSLRRPNRIYKVAKAVCRAVCWFQLHGGTDCCVNRSCG